MRARHITHGERRIGARHDNVDNLAAMLGNDLAIKLLLEKGADPNARDWRQYTPCHHLAIRGDKLALQLFRKTLTTDFTLLNDCDGTVEDIENMRAMPAALEDTHVEVWDAATQSVVTKSADQIFDSSLRFSDEIYTTAVRLVEFWKNRPENLGTCLFDAYFGNRFRAARKLPSRVYVDTECETDAGVKIAGLGLVLKAKVKIGRGRHPGLSP